MPFPIDGPEANRAERLWSVYALERSADQATPQVSFTIATVSVTYIATTIALLLSRSAATPLPVLITLLIPVLPVGLFSSLVAQNQESQIRGYYLNLLENELRRMDGVDHRGNTIPPAPPLPAFRLWSSSPAMAETVTYKNAIIVLLQPYFLATAIIEVYVLYVLDFYQATNTYALVATVAYTSLMLSNAVQIYRSRDYLHHGPRQITSPSRPRARSWKRLHKRLRGRARRTVRRRLGPWGRSRSRRSG
jgi:hypothetical protein